RSHGGSSLEKQNPEAVLHLVYWLLVLEIRGSSAVAMSGSVKRIGKENVVVFINVESKR
ncbi:unnamed protein product, partial [Brassica rapa subsp. narinosa]